MTQETAPQFDFSTLSKQQQSVLAQVALGNDAGHNPGTLKSLVRRGLIEEYIIPSRFYAGISASIYRYRMPIYVHIQWCRWCAETVDEE